MLFGGFSQFRGNPHDKSIDEGGRSCHRVVFRGLSAIDVQGDHIFLQLFLRLIKTAGKEDAPVACLLLIGEEYAGF